MKSIKIVVIIIFAALFVGSVSSCNRGVGCPNKFSISK